MAILRLVLSLKAWSCFSFCGECQSHMGEAVERRKTNGAPARAGRTPAQALDVQSQAGIAGTSLGGVLSLVALLSSYPARMAPKPVAAAIRTSRLLGVGLWACLRLQTEGRSAGHGGSRRDVFVRSLGGRESVWLFTGRGGRTRGTMRRAEMTGRVL